MTEVPVADNVMERERADVGSYEDIVAAAERTTGMQDMGGTEHEGNRGRKVLYIVKSLVAAVKDLERKPAYE